MPDPLSAPILYHSVQKIASCKIFIRQNKSDEENDFLSLVFLWFKVGIIVFFKKNDKKREKAKKTHFISNTFGFKKEK